MILLKENHKEEANFELYSPALTYNIQLCADYCTPSDFLIYVLVCTAQSTKSMKTNDIPLKSPMKLQQEMQEKISNFQNLLDF